MLLRAWASRSLTVKTIIKRQVFCTSDISSKEMERQPAVWANFPVGWIPLHCCQPSRFGFYWPKTVAPLKTAWKSAFHYLRGLMYVQPRTGLNKLRLFPKSTILPHIVEISSVPIPAAYHESRLPYIEQNGDNFRLVTCHEGIVDSAYSNEQSELSCSLPLHFVKRNLKCSGEASHFQSQRSQTDGGDAIGANYGSMITSLDECCRREKG